MIAHEDIDDGPLYSKCHKVWCCPSLCIPCNCLFHPCRKAVSRKKKRFEKDGYDLDLVYMTNRIIVHGFPATGLEHIYRNPRYEIRRLLDANHPDRYRVYNFCCEPGRGYSPSVFHGNVRRFPFKDHNTPPLKTLVAFANDAKGWLDQDENNVCSLHCKAGKGRAGLMCCVLLVRTGTCQSALEAMDYYDKHRVENNRGLTVTSQRKYVIFYEMLWRQYWGVVGDIGQVPAVTGPMESSPFSLPHEPTVRIVGVQLLGLWISAMKGFHIKIFQGTNFSPIVVCDEGVPESTSSDSTPTHVTPSGTVKHKWRCDCEVTGNFKIVINQKTLTGQKKILELWHNTLFLEIDPSTCTADLAKDQMDIKRKISPRLGDDLVIRIFFAETATSPSQIQVQERSEFKLGTSLGELDAIETSGNGVELSALPKGKYQEVPSR